MKIKENMNVAIEKDLYFINHVIDNNHFFMRPYHALSENGVVRLYRTKKELYDHLGIENKGFDGYRESKNIEMKYRYNRWKRVIRYGFDGSELPKPYYEDMGKLKFIKGE